jgi:hypothetical protein
MHIVPLAWMFVVLLMTVAEATSSQGSLLGALITLLLYGVLPLSVVMYVMGTPARGRARRAAEAKASQAPSGDAGDGGGHPTGARIAPEREEP